DCPCAPRSVCVVRAPAAQASPLCVRPVSRRQLPVGAGQAVAVAGVVSAGCTSHEKAVPPPGSLPGGGTACLVWVSVTLGTHVVLEDQSCDRDQGEHDAEHDQEDQPEGETDGEERQRE